MVHIGKQIKKVLNENGMGVSELARKINTNRNNIYDIFKRQSIDTTLLKKISGALHYDFFTYFISTEEINPEHSELLEQNTAYQSKFEIQNLRKKIEQIEKENLLLRCWLKDKERIIEMLQKKEVRSKK